MKLFLDFAKILWPIVNDITGGKRLSREQTLALVGVLLAGAGASGIVGLEEIAGLDPEVLNESVWQAADGILQVGSAFAVLFFGGLAAKRQREDV